MGILELEQLKEEEAVEEAHSTTQLCIYTQLRASGAVQSGTPLALQASGSSP